MFDLRSAVRALAGGWPFTLVATFCLALAIATNTTMFSVFDAMFLRPLPFLEPARLVLIAGRHPETGRRVALSLQDMRDVASATTSFERMAAYGGGTATLTDGGEPERVSVQGVTASLFPMLGVDPQRGRTLEPRDDLIAAAGVVVISDAVWHRRYAADPSAIGRLIRLDDRPYTIVGIMLPKFRFPSQSDAWIALTPALELFGARGRGVSIVARLAPQVSIEQANAELAARVLPASGSRSVRAGVARPFSSMGIGSEERLITGSLMGATAVLVLMACVNVANLLLARGAGRRREIAVRAALGASRGRIIRQLLTESVMISLAAGLIALPLAWYGIRWIHDAVPPTEPLGPYYVDWSLDLRTLSYAFAIALVTGIAFGIAPAFDATGRRLLNPLREGGGAGSGRVQRRVHSILIVAQTALALALLAAASLFIRSYAGQRAIELGYDPSHLMTFRFYLSGHPYDQTAPRFDVVDRIAERLASLPGAAAATVTDLVPLDDQGGSDATAEIEGRTFPEGREPTVHYAGVTDRWPETFAVNVSPGRAFLPDELRRDAPVAIVNSKLASTFWLGQNPIGRRFRFADDPANPWFSVIGVVPDIRTLKLDESGTTPPTAYVPHRFLSTRNYGIVVRTQGTPESVIPAVRAAVHAADPSIALFDVYPMNQVRWLSYWMYVMWGTLFGIFGAIAIVIAAVGVYGVVFYTVAQRTREIGLRVALGARRIQVVGPMVRKILLLSVIGLVIGFGGALAFTPVIGSLLIGVGPNDPVGFSVVGALLIVVAVAATWIPAWRASTIDPTVALREE